MLAICFAPISVFGEAELQAVGRWQRLVVVCYAANGKGEIGACSLQL
jgi:hypothetical protein